MTVEDVRELDPELGGPPPMNPLNLTVIELERFIFVVRAISDNKLWGAVRAHLRAEGCTTIAVSAEPIVAIKQLLRQRAGQQHSGNGHAPRPAQPDHDQQDTYEEPVAPPRPAAQSGTDRRLDRFLTCACGTPPQVPHNPPPEEWNPYPWNQPPPPQMLEAGN